MKGPHDVTIRTSSAALTMFILMLASISDTRFRARRRSLETVLSTSVIRGLPGDVGESSDPSELLAQWLGRESGGGRV